MRVRLFLVFLIATVVYPQQPDSKRPWKGYSILGNGHLTAVYSDDSRITSATGASGIQHFYFHDYTADYIASTSFHLSKAEGAVAVGMKNFFTAESQRSLPDGAQESVLCFVHPDDAAVLSLAVTGTTAKLPYSFEVLLRKEIKTDRDITMTSLEVKDNIAVGVWSNGTALAVAPLAPEHAVTSNGASVVVKGSVDRGPAQIVLIPASSPAEAVRKMWALQRKKDVEAEARTYWDAWMDSGRVPAKYAEQYKRNLYCVKAATLNGQIPADITGQFVTNNMPQLYPRDAMMCARVLLLTGHTEEARQVIEFWANPRIPRKTPGEWYARYDAHDEAVDGGSGARFDEPEWDANGYFIYLLNEYHRAKGVWLANSKQVYDLADFLVSHISSNGLLQEGGIVEWTGYLPATNMICAAALQTAATIAREFGNEKKAASYNAAAKRITAALPQMFDKSRQTYADVRFTDRKGELGESLAGQAGEKTYLWDTTANVGAIWGYPNHRALELSNQFYAKNTVKLDGGMQYFDSPEPSLAAYGHGDFFFTTAAAAQYQLMYGRKAAAKGFLDWMLRNANSYGLMPERILPEASDVSPASPLSWCSAEFAAALLLWSQG